MRSGKGLLHKVERTIEHYQMILPGEKVLVAVSGGIDSTVLLYLLHLLSRERGYSLHVAHLNHMLRGEESERDADFVRDYCAQLGVQSTIRALSVKEAAAQARDSLQEEARKVRYAFLSEVAQEVGARRIATGHTLDDQAETVLLNMLRGAGTAGLRGIPPVREGRFVRPLIETSRKEIERYARQHQIPFVTDSSNLKATYLRNRIRLRLLPLLHQEYNPQLSEALASTASILQEEEDLLHSLTLTRLPSLLLRQREGEVALSIPPLLKEPIALQRRILIEAARMVGTSSYLPLSHHHIFALQDLLTAHTGAQFALPQGMVAIKDYDRLILARTEEGPIGSWEYPVATDGLTAVPEAKLSLKAMIRGRQEVNLSESTPLHAFLDLDRIVPPLVVRNRRPGDRFWPLGVPGAEEKKLKEFFIDAKVSRPRRDEI
ncbi:MAG: tRNA lysidine(34) synthetase TilS, partial [candidate division NC10 bacterium]|nr:tRNA lysidine(34) synthetase TilS [candidate division NC10 bacterium]